MSLDRHALKELREAPWRSVDELRGFVERVAAVDRRDVESLLKLLTDPKLDAGPQHQNRCSAFKTLCLRAPDPSYFDPLVHALGNADPLLRKAIVAILPKVNDVDRHELLCAQLGHADREVRRDVAAVLEAVGGPSALRELTKLVSKQSFPGRRDAIEVMVPKARHRAIDLLGAVLSSGTMPDRLRAIELLGDRELMSGDLGAAVEQVVRVLDDRDNRVSEAAFKAFANLADEETFYEALEPRLHAEHVSPVLVEALGHFKTRRSADLLTARMRRGPTAVQLAAIRALRVIGSNDVIPGLVEALHLEDPTLRRTAQDALLELGGSSSVDLAKLLLSLLASPLPHVRRAAAAIAGTVKTGRSLTDQLLEALVHEDWWVRERVLDAIVELQLPQLADGLVGFLGDERPEIRRYAVFGLLRLRDPATLGAMLRTSVSDPDWWVREQAVQAIGVLGDDRAIPYLEALLADRPDLRVAVIEALGLLHADDSLMKHAELTADPDPSTRLSMIEAIGQLDRGREASFFVQACTNDEEPRVAKLARELLERWKIATDADASASVGLLDRLLVATARHGADDLMLSPGRPPFVKHLGEIQPISKGILDEAEMEKMVLPILSNAQRDALAGGSDVDLSYDIPGFDLRYRINVFRQLSGLSAVFRRVHQDLPGLDDLGLPDVVKRFADYPNGLVLVGGPTGSGKSTTLAALIGYINEHHGRHIVTIEDPIEYVHPQRESLVNQREVGSHAPTFAAALRATLRQDPDVILVGELRDRETIEFAVNAAETGHLVFATVHTTSAATSIDRLIHACEPARQPVIRAMLAESLRAVLCQQLLRSKDASGRRVLACEILVNTDAVSNLIRKDKSFQLPSVITTNADQGMRLMDADLAALVRDGVVDPHDAALKAQDKGAFTELLAALEQGREVQGGLHGTGSTVGGRSSLPPRASVVPPKMGGA
ncbi:MAG: PilT/PilU family type 4a pilus ATPase [Myxococcales bacterium]|nr:PilT/PilU family type 4a pilus ATPase [Myxococcales bacterium]